MAVLLGHAMVPANAASTDIANSPMAVSNMVTPNVLVVYDNSQSMDAYMNGTLVSGNDPNTRSNIGRTVMRNAIGTYRNTFNWGLMTYGMTGTPDLRNTYAFYMGSDVGMVFTDDCIGYVSGIPPTIGISASNGNRRCVANPQPFPLANFVTFDKSGDDADVQDVLYWNGGVSSLWGLTSGPGTAYRFYGLRTPAVANSWIGSNFTGAPLGPNPVSFTPTDAGYLPQNPPITRQVYVPRGWGYIKEITGFGALVKKVDADSATHYSTLIASLGNETNGATSEIKNGALFTPLRGSLESARTYYSGLLADNISPVQYSCQQNFVMLVTDGMPTGNTSGNLYSATERANSCAWSTATNSCTTGSFGTAAIEARTAANALRTITVTTGLNSTNKDGTGTVTGKYDVQTYIVALGETVANADALSVMNAMAFSGGTGKAIAAGDAIAFQDAITKISDDITAKVGTASAVAVANARVTSSDNASYTSSYNSGTWTGDLSANAINVTTGVASATPLWTAGSASTQLDLRTPASRFIATSTDVIGGIGGVQFQPTTATTATKLSAAQQTLLGATDGAAVLAYLRGDRSGEPGTFRARSHLLGDMINAEPVLVREPSATYTDTGYSAFKTANASRTRMLYQAANDGMLHAFVAETGAESWAYVPNLVMEDLSNLTLTSGFNHKYYVDGTPASADVDFANIEGTTSGGDWRTLLVGGLGKGGRGYYALDVSSPTASNEVTVKNKVLWEFPNSIQDNGKRNAAKKNMGYSFGKPLLVKTTAKGWVVLFTSGYNNGTDTGGDGEGHLYVVNPKTGDLIKDISTSNCTSAPAANACGLAQISVSLASNNTVDYVYGGDLKGNVWRFDLTGSSADSWAVEKFANLKDATAASQPITAAPQLTFNSGVRMVYVGTGQYLGNTDIPGSMGANASSSQTQTMYGLKDSLTTLPMPLRPNLQQQTLTTSGSTRTITNNLVNYALKNGWYIDLPITGERLFTQVAAYSNNLVFTSNIPSSTKCEPGGSSWLQVVNSKTGGLADFAGTGAVSGISFGNVLSSSPVLFQLPNNSWRLIVHTSAPVTAAPAGSLIGGGTGDSCTVGANSTVTCVPPSPSSPTIKRSWRQLFLY